MEDSSINLSYDETKRPEKAKTSGSGNYCCIPECKSTQYKTVSKEKVKTNIGFFRFPIKQSILKCKKIQWQMNAVVSNAL